MYFRAPEIWTNVNFENWQRKRVRTPIFHYCKIRIFFKKYRDVDKTFLVKKKQNREVYDFIFELCVSLFFSTLPPITKACFLTFCLKKIIHYFLKMFLSTRYRLKRVLCFHWYSLCKVELFYVRNCHCRPFLYPYPPKNQRTANQMFLCVNILKKVFKNMDFYLKNPKL